MAITIDATSESTEKGAGSYSWSHTVSGSNTLLVVIMHIRSGTSDVSTLTYDGETLTKAIAVQSASGVTTEIWYKVNPASGSNTIAVTLTGPGNENSWGVAASYNGVLQTSPLDQTASETGTNDDPDVDITPTEDNELVIGGVTHEAADPLSTGSGETTIYNLDGGSWVVSSSYAIQTTAALQTVNYTGNISSIYAIAAATFKGIVTVTEDTEEESASSGAGGASETNILGPFLKQKNYLFIIETPSGEQRGMTENWDFDSITREINGSMTCNLTTNETLDTFRDGKTDIANNIIIRVSTSNTAAIGLDYYSGYLPQRSLILTGQEERIMVRSFGHISRLYQAIWRDGTTTTHNYTASGADPTTIIKDIIDDWRALYSNAKINYNAASTENVGTTVKTKFEAMTFGRALEEAAELAHTTNRKWYWRVLGDNVFTFKRASTGPDHSLLMGRDISELRLEEDLVNAANEAFVYFNNSTIRRYSDSDNIDINGYISEFIRKTNVTDTNTADEIGNAILENKLPALLKIGITVNDDYVNGIETIDPGDTVEILNLPDIVADLLTSNMLVTKTVYRKDEVDLELSIKHPRLDSRIENIAREFNNSRKEGLPTTYTDV